MISLEELKKNPQLLEFIKQTEIVLADLSYTGHGSRHAELVASRAKMIADKIGLNSEEQEMAAIAGFCHDMANFISRGFHNYFGALLFSQVFGNDFEPKKLVTIMEAIANHDKKKEDMNFASAVSAAVVLADKSDVHRSRVTVKTLKEIKTDIHDRVNYATQASDLKINKKKKRIDLQLKIDNDFVPIMEYFEIFTKRMVFCRKAAEYLGYDFGLIINKFKLL